MCFLTSFTFCIHVKDEKVIILIELGKLKEECLLLRRCHGPISSGSSRGGLVAGTMDSGGGESWTPSCRPASSREASVQGTEASKTPEDLIDLQRN
jgi:hypothetical protein